MAVNGNGNPGDTFEILRVGGDDNVHILRPADHAPGIEGETTDQNKLHLRFREPTQKLIESWFGQSERAEPVNRINLWLSAMPSARFTLMGRWASARSRCIRTASASAAASRDGLPDCWIDAMSTQ